MVNPAVELGERAVAAMPDGGAGHDIEADTRFVGTYSSPLPSTVWFEEHLATPRDDWTEFVDNARVSRLVVLDALHDPGSVEKNLRRNLVVDGRRVLVRLSPESAQALARMLHVDSLRGQWPQVRANGAVSELLVAPDGTPIGLVTLRATVRPRLEVGRSDRTPLETYHRSMTGNAGTAALHNATESAFSATGTVIRESIEQTSTAGTFASGGPGSTVRGSTSTRITAHSGTETTASRGQKNAGTDTVLADADITWTARLIAEDEESEISWTGTVAQGEGARLRYVPTTFTPSPQQLWPPAGVLDGDGPGLTDVDEFRFDAAPAAGSGAPVVGVDQAVKAVLLWAPVRGITGSVPGRPTSPRPDVATETPGTETPGTETPTDGGPSTAASPDKPMDVSQLPAAARAAGLAYLRAADNPGRWTAIFAVLPAADHATIAALADFTAGQARALEKEDRAEAEALRLLAHALSDSYRGGEEPRGIRHLRREAAYELISLLLLWRRRLPKHRAALVALLDALATCMTV